MAQLILEGHLVLNDGVVLGQVSVDNGTIRHVTTDREAFAVASERLSNRELLAPGFVDIQINGAFGREFKTDADAVSWVSERLPAFGTTAFCPTVTTMPKDNYDEWLTVLGDDASRATGARPLGFHVEGPALNAARVGAQNADLLVTPKHLDTSLLKRHDIRLWTLSPELEGGWAKADELKRAGVTVGIGHSLVEYDAFVANADPQSMIVVHAFNAMADLNSRKPGLIGAVLDWDELRASIIADKIHVSEATLRVFWKAKRDKKKVVAITDGSAVTGLPVGVHTVGTRVIEKRLDRAVLEGTETLVGSILTLDVAVRNLVEVLGCTISEAVACVTANPASAIGASGEIGVLRPGARADFAVLDQNLSVTRTIMAGETVWER